MPPWYLLHEPPMEDGHNASRETVNKTWIWWETEDWSTLPKTFYHVFCEGPLCKEDFLFNSSGTLYVPESRILRNNA